MAHPYPRFQFPGGTVGIRKLDLVDGVAYLALAQASGDLLQGWIHPPMDQEGFEALLEKTGDRSFEALTVLEGPENRMVGMIHLSQIFYGAFENAYLSYWLGMGFHGRGIMTEAMRLVLHLAMDRMALHRLEANIQPGNDPSIALVRRLGFVLEGYSEKYLKVQGQWRDHARWAIHREIWPERDFPEESKPHWIHGK